MTVSDRPSIRCDGDAAIGSVLPDHLDDFVLGHHGPADFTAHLMKYAIGGHWREPDRPIRKAMGNGTSRKLAITGIGCAILYRLCLVSIPR